MSHWYTQGLLGAEHRGDLDREAARESLRSEARANDARPGILRGRFVGLARLLGAPGRRFARFRHRAGSAIAEPPVSEPRAAVPAIHP